MVEKRHVVHFVKARLRAAEGKLWRRPVTWKGLAQIWDDEIQSLQLNMLLVTADDARGDIVVFALMDDAVLLVNFLH